MSNSATPKAIRLRDRGAIFILEYEDLGIYELSAEYLRISSPSAEVQGHFGEGGELPVGKEQVCIKKIDRSGHYAIRIHFDDGHDSGIYTWEYLQKLAQEKDQRWQEYMEALRKTGQTRNPNVQVIKLIDPNS